MPESVGASFAAVMLTVVVALVVGLRALPSLSVQVTVRVGSAPKLVGFSLAVTERDRIEHLLVMRQRVGAGELSVSVAAL